MNSPDGYIEFDKPVDNTRYGYLFTWSDVYNGWLKHHNKFVYVYANENYTECHARHNLGSPNIRIFFKIDS